MSSYLPNQITTHLEQGHLRTPMSNNRAVAVPVTVHVVAIAAATSTASCKLVQEQHEQHQQQHVCNQQADFLKTPPPLRKHMAVGSKDSGWH